MLHCLGYGMLISAAFVAMPGNPDAIAAPADLVTEFRIMSVLGVTSFWASVGIILGLLWRPLASGRMTARPRDS